MKVLSSCAVFLITLLLALPSAVQARPHVHVGIVTPRVVVVAPPPPPPPSPELVWVEAHYDRAGRWVPAHWERGLKPPRPGWVYVAGRWDRGAWVQGFWRPARRPGYHWVATYQGPDGRWAAGTWVPDAPAPEGVAWQPGYWDGYRWIPGRWIAVEVMAPPTAATPRRVPDNGARLGADEGEEEELALPADELPEAPAAPTTPTRGAKTRHAELPD
jgi:hypothetical protein